LRLLLKGLFVPVYLRMEELKWIPIRHRPAALLISLQAEGHLTTYRRQPNPLRRHKVIRLPRSRDRDIPRPHRKVTHLRRVTLLNKHTHPHRGIRLSSHTLLKGKAILPRRLILSRKDTLPDRPSPRPRGRECRYSCG
jgi:hypothetical protein